jgi:hypothetical protein
MLVSAGKEFESFAMPEGDRGRDFVRLSAALSASNPHETEEKSATWCQVAGGAR